MGVLRLSVCQHSRAGVEGRKEGNAILSPRTPLPGSLLETVGACAGPGSDIQGRALSGMIEQLGCAG